MEPEPKNASVSMTTSSPDSPSTIKTPSTVAVSQWEEYLTGKKVLAKRFLAKIEKGGIIYPDEATKDRFAIALKAKPDRIGRLLLLLQASNSSCDSIRRIVQEFAEAGIKRLAVVSFSELIDATTFEHSVSSWLAGIRKKPLKQADLNILALLLHFGWHRRLVDQNTALSLVATAVSKPAKPKSKKLLPQKPAQTSLEIFLAAAPTASVLSSLLSYSEMWKFAADKLNAQIQSQAAIIEHLTAECDRLNTNIACLDAEIVKLKAQDAANKVRICELEKQIVDIRDGYQHKLDDLRGRIRGMLQMQLTRWLQTALDATRSDPPWTKAIQERLEDALKLIEKELQWMQPSA